MESLTNNPQMASAFQNGDKASSLDFQSSENDSEDLILPDTFKQDSSHQSASQNTATLDECRTCQTCFGPKSICQVSCKPCHVILRSSEDLLRHFDHVHKSQKEKGLFKEEAKDERFTIEVSPQDFQNEGSQEDGEQNDKKYNYMCHMCGKVFCTGKNGLARDHVKNYHKITTESVLNSLCEDGNAISIMVSSSTSPARQTRSIKIRTDVRGQPNKSDLFSEGSNDLTTVLKKFHELYGSFPPSEEFADFFQQVVSDDEQADDYKETLEEDDLKDANKRKRRRRKTRISYKTDYRIDCEEGEDEVDDDKDDDYFDDETNGDLEGTVLECPKCDKTYTSEQRLYTHNLRVHEKKDKCKYCSFEFAENEYYEEHLKLEHPTELYNHLCKECSKFFKLPRHLTDHVDSSHAGELSCDACGETFKSLKLLQSHIMEVHESDDKCMHCNVLLTSLESSYQDHVKEEHSDKLITHTCQICNAFLHKPSTIDEHIKREHSSEDLKCNICGRKCRSIKSLKSHKREVHSKSKHECNICGIECKNLRSLQNHRSQVHQKRGTSKPDQCAYCDLTFESSETYQLHLAQAHKDKVNDRICQICGMVFACARNAKKHVQTVHSGEQVFCHVCGKSFTCKAYLQSHVKLVHLKNEQVTLKCDLCDFTAIRPYMIRKHVASIHEGIRNFVCDNCGKKFSQKGNLDKHVKRVHSGIKDHVCPTCGKCFSVPETLSKHIKIVHEGMKTIKCPTCVRRFFRQEAVDRHLQNGCDGKKRKSRAKAFKKAPPAPMLM